MGNETSQQVKYGDRLDNDIKITWKKSSTENPFPARDGHCAASVGQKLYIFGGVLQTDAQGDEIQETNDLIIYDIESESWSKAVVKGEAPAARSSATLVAMGNKLYLYGGLSQHSGWLEGMHVYDTETNIWSRPETTGPAPSPRDKLSSAMVGQRIYFFGGFGPQGVEEVEEDEDEEGEAPQDQEGAQFGWFNDLHIFNPATRAWSSPMQMNLGVPTPRAAHALCSIGKYLVIFGGRDSESRKNDTHIFDTETRKWLTELELSGRQPDPRSFHTANTVGDRVVVLGGRGTANQHFEDFNIFDTKTRQWLQPSMEGDQLPARGVHTATVVGEWLLVFGGSSDFNADLMMCTKYFNDLYMVKTEEILSHGPRPRDPTPPSGASQSVVTPPSGASQSEVVSSWSGDASVASCKRAASPESSTAVETSPSKTPRTEADIMAGKAIPRSAEENQENIAVKNAMVNGSGNAQQQ